MKYLVFFACVFFSSCTVLKRVSCKNSAVPETEESAIAYNYAFTEATKQKLFGNYSQALSLLFKCISVNPSSSAAYYLISEIYLKNGQSDKALDYCRLAVDNDSKNVWYRLDLATLYKMNNKLDSAIYQYKIVVKKNPGNFKYKYNLAALYFENNDLYNSLKIIKALSENDNKNEELALTKFQIQRKLKQYRGAEKTLKKIYKRLPNDYKYLGLLAEHYKSIGNIEKGEKTYRELLLKDSLNEIGIIGLASFYLESNRINEAEVLIKKRLLLDNNTSENEIVFLSNNLKISEISKSFKDEIVKLIKNWFVLNPDNGIDVKSLTDLMIGGGYIKDASELLEFLYQNKSDFKNLDTYLMVLNLEDSNEKLLKITSDSLNKGESSDYLFYYNGLGYYKKKMFKEASAVFGKGIAFLGEGSIYEEQILTLLGECYYKMKDVNTAFDYYEKVLKINPYNLYVLNNYSYYLAILNSDLDKAEEMSKKCIMMDRKNFNYLDTYGWILVKKGKYLEAFDILKKAVDLGGKADNNIEGHYRQLLKIMNVNE